MRLEENERDNITRLMKVKDMIIADEQEKARAETAKNIAEYKEKQIRAGSSKRQRKKNLYCYGHTWR